MAVASTRRLERPRARALCLWLLARVESASGGGLAPGLAHRHGPRTAAAAYEALWRLLRNILQPERPKPRRPRASETVQPEQPAAQLRAWLKERLPGSPCALAELTEELSEGFGDVGPLGSVDAACESQELRTRVFPTLARLASVRDDAELPVMIGRFGLTELERYLAVPARSGLLIELYSALLQGIWESAGIAVEVHWPQLAASGSDVPQQLWVLALGDSTAYDPLLGGLLGRGLSSTLRPVARRAAPQRRDARATDHQRRSAWTPDRRKPEYDDFTRPRVASSSESAAPSTYEYSEPVSGIVPALPRPHREEPDDVASDPQPSPESAGELATSAESKPSTPQAELITQGRPTSLATIWTLCCAIIAVAGLAVLFAPLHDRPEGAVGPRSLLGLRVLLAPLGPRTARAPASSQPSAAVSSSAPIDAERPATEPVTSDALPWSTQELQTVEPPRPARRAPVARAAPESGPADDEPLPYVIEFSPIPGDTTLSIGDLKLTGFGTLLVSDLPENVTLIARRDGYQTRIINIARSSFSQQAGVYWRRLYVTLRSNEEVAAVLESASH